MNEALLVSNIVLWVVVLVLAGVVLALARQLGVLYERVAPAGALVLGHGPGVGDHAPVVTTTELGGASLEIGAPSADGRSTLLFFVSPTCPVCKTLLPVLRSIARREHRRLRLVLASDGARAEHEDFVHQQGLDRLPYVLSPTLGITYQVAKLPYAVLLDAGGVIRSKGLVNTREHLESLLEAEDHGVGSIQDFVRATTEREGVA